MAFSQLNCLKARNRLLLSAAEIDRMMELIKLYMNGNDDQISESDRNSVLFAELSRYVPRDSVIFSSQTLKKEFLGLCITNLNNMQVCIILLLLL